MGDMVGDFAAMKELGQMKRRGNLKNSTALLEKAGVSFTSHNNGVHLVVEGKWDFWPSTGLFINRISRKKRRGIMNLLRRLNA